MCITSRGEAQVDEGLEQFLARDRFLHHRRRAEGESLGPIRQNRDDDDGDALQIGHLLHAAEEVPTIQILHHHVQGDHCQWLFRRDGQRYLRGLGVTDDEALRFELQSDQLRGLRVIFDHQRCLHPRIRRRNR